MSEQEVEENFSRLEITRLKDDVLEVKLIQEFQNTILQKILAYVSPTLPTTTTSSMFTPPSAASSHGYHAIVVSPSASPDSSASIPMSVQHRQQAANRDRKWRDDHPDADLIASLRDEQNFEGILKATYPKLHKLR